MRWLCLLGVVLLACAPAAPKGPAATGGPPAATASSTWSAPSSSEQAAAPPATTAKPRIGPPPSPRLRFLSVGDVLLSRGVAEAIEAEGDPELPFSRMAKDFARVDFVFANLECPFAKKTVLPVRGNIFNAPQPWITGLKKHRFTVLNLANNHALDQGEQGLYDTIGLLREHELTGFGAGRNEREAWAPIVVEHQGIRIGFVGASYASINDDGSTYLKQVARIEDKGRLQRAIADLQTRSDFVVATMHAGIEYVPVAFGPQQLFAKAAVEAGADLVIGAHPHVVQPVVFMDGVPVFYSLGNFIFDQTKKHTDEGAAVLAELVRDGDDVRLDRLEVWPVVIEGGVPRRVEGPRSDGVLARMKVPSAVLIPKAPATDN